MHSKLQNLSKSLRTLVISDIHGAFKALEQVVERSGFDPEHDQMVFLGDLVDGYPDIPDCLDYLLGVRNLVYVMGNHDDWALRYAEGRLSDVDFVTWDVQGGRATRDSLGERGSPRWQSLRELLHLACPYATQGSRVFVHGGFSRHAHPSTVPLDDLIWDRDLLSGARLDCQNPAHAEQCGEVFLGHTPTVFYHTAAEPIFASNIVAIDCGVSYPRHGGRLCIMDASTKQYWLSDPVGELYPGTSPRGI